MRNRSMRSGTKLAREIQLTDWSTAGNLSNRSSGVQIPRDICTRFGRYLYSTKCSLIINAIIIINTDEITSELSRQNRSHCYGNIIVILNRAFCSESEMVISGVDTK